MKISENIEEEEESKLDESHGDQWLAKFDNYGNVIDQLIIFGPKGLYSSLLQIEESTDCGQERNNFFCLTD